MPSQQGQPSQQGLSRLQQFRLPDLGEGLTEGEILQWLVKEGDEITLNQLIVEVETAKAAVEVPSPYAGVVHQIHHAAGEMVDVGAPIITVDTDPTAGPTEPARSAAAGAAANPVESAAPKAARAVGSRAEVLADTVPAAAGALIGETAANGRTATLVGYGPRAGAATRRARADAPPPAAPEVAPSPPPATAARVSAAAVGRLAQQSAGAVTVLAKPPVRKLAKDLGVDLSVLHGTGPHGTVTRADVEAAAAQPAGGRQGGDAPEAAPSYDPQTRERRVPVKGVRKATAAAMVASAFSAPHVTEFVTLDMTPSMELLGRLKALPEFADVKLTPLLLVAKALLLAVRRNPEVNSTWDEAAQEIVVKDYVNLGIAAATPRGLLVPNVKDADAMSLAELATALQQLVGTAREGRTSPADMARGTITITNVGVFGVDNGTPILNPGESAILCFGAVRPMPWVVDGQLAVRQVTQLALSFDHRVVDGQLGSQFLSDIARVLADPATALAWS
ncbi:MAG TPA: dihydrolipoamide acetyltransferase family protein [Mycobacteriales bacterium]|jgi:pyruvate dehydrogenase E2 component (dihydrolipoamide acetyltransferase)|nr:dihydrolipoamide acetyltransferase family protein [Mycobacteriales bacterium]